MADQTTLLIEDDFENQVKVFMNDSTHAFLEIEQGDNMAFALLNESQLMALSDKARALSKKMLLHRIEKRKRESKLV